MISPLILEKNGRWRYSVLTVTLFIILLPILLMLLNIAREIVIPNQNLENSHNLFILNLGTGFWSSFLNSTLVFFFVALIALVIGAPIGIISGIYNFKGRKYLLTLSIVPLLIPTFLLAIGYSQIKHRLGFLESGILESAFATILTFSATTIPLVIFVTLIAVRSLTQNQIESIRLIGDEKHLFLHVLKTIFPMAFLSSLLGSVLSFSDPGPGQIFGFYGVSYEILLSFSAFYDFVLAARQCLVSTLIILIFITPVLYIIAPSISPGLIGKITEPSKLRHNKMVSSIGILLLIITIFIILIIPTIGLILPLFRGFPVERAFLEIFRTLNNTVIYAITSGFLAVLFGLTLALAVGRIPNLRRALLMILIAYLFLPPFLNSLGLINLSTLAPAYFDFILRSRFTVGLISALHFCPISALIFMRLLGQTSSTQVEAAAVHGVSISKYFIKILLPQMIPDITIAFLIIALLSTSEVGTALMLRPPGADSLPIQIFTIMANAPESLVAALCFIYIIGALGVFILAWFLAKFRKGAT